MKDPRDEIQDALQHQDFLERIDAMRGYDAAEKRLLDRLEAAEKDALEQARLNGMGSERELALMAKLEAAEKERDAAELMSLALRAKVEEMERQEPVAWWGRGPRDGRIEFSVHKPAPSVMRDFAVTPLYALPGAQPQLNEIRTALQRALELGQRETWTGARRHRSWEDQREEQQCWNKVWSLLGEQGEEK